MAKLAYESDLTNIVLTTEITRDNNEDLLNRMTMNQAMQAPAPQLVDSLDDDPWGPVAGDEGAGAVVTPQPVDSLDDDPLGPKDSDVDEEASAAVAGLAEMSQDNNEEWHSRMAMNQAMQADEAVEEPVEAPAPQLVDSLDDDPLGPVAGDDGAGAVVAPQPVDPLDDDPFGPVAVVEAAGAAVAPQPVDSLDDDPLGPGAGDAAAGGHAIEKIVKFFVSKQCAGYITGEVYFTMF